jgi:hypothetical protein
VCTEHKVDLDGIVIGQQLRLPASYLREAVDVVTELGWKLTQVVWRKLHPDETAEATNALINETFELLKVGGFKIAGTMLKFGLSLRRQSDDQSGKIMVVNLAIATKLAGDTDGAMGILEKEDWSASSNKFRICVAAVRGDIEEVVRLMPTVDNNDIDRNDFREWPAFQSVAGDQKFVHAFEHKFREPFMLDRDSQDEPTQTVEAASVPIASSEKETSSPQETRKKEDLSD